LPNKKLFKKKNVYILLILLAQFAVAETLSANEIRLGINFPINNLEILSLTLFFITAVTLFINCSLSGKNVETAMFFAFVNVFLGFYHSNNPSALTIFFSTAMLTLTIAILENLYYTTYKDAQTGLLSRNSFVLQAKELPLKYSIGVIAIDNYDSLKKAFGKNGGNDIVKMIAGLIDQSETPNIYRYDEDEFVLIFKNDTIKESFASIEKIRRLIASSEFMIRRGHKNLKLTVSAGVSEKKRSDADAIDVLVRARKALQKASKFTQNVTTRA
jgi:diguanylate cyclase (GGDEF)-like protein